MGEHGLCAHCQRRVFEMTLTHTKTNTHTHTHTNTHTCEPAANAPGWLRATALATLCGLAPKPCGTPAPNGTPPPPAARQGMGTNIKCKACGVLSLQSAQHIVLHCSSVHSNGFTHPRHDKWLYTPGMTSWGTAIPNLCYSCCEHKPAAQFEQESLLLTCSFSYTVSFGKRTGPSVGQGLVMSIVLCNGMSRVILREKSCVLSSWSRHAMAQANTNFKACITARASHDHKLLTA